ncbi:MAG: hypothetical protein KAR00_03520 [Candidatus Pacebacteria bacterium]|nr:hypothetical protein [Candidatus Paceibacterota bacterium]
MKKTILLFAILVAAVLNFCLVLNSYAASVPRKEPSETTPKGKTLKIRLTNGVPGSYVVAHDRDGNVLFCADGPTKEKEKIFHGQTCHVNVVYSFWERILTSPRFTLYFKIHNAFTDEVVGIVERVAVLKLSNRRGGYYYGRNTVSVNVQVGIINRRGRRGRRGKYMYGASPFSYPRYGSVAPMQRHRPKEIYSTDGTLEIVLHPKDVEWLSTAAEKQFSRK